MVISKMDTESSRRFLSFPNSQFYSTVYLGNDYLEIFIYKTISYCYKLAIKYQFSLFVFAYLLFQHFHESLGHF